MHTRLTLALLGKHHARALVAAAAASLVFLAAACGGGSSNSANAAGRPDVISITSPANDATVGRSFRLSLESSVAIGDPSTGLHHVHLYYDGKRSQNEADYDKVYGRTFTVTRLAPGRHTIEAVLANADHSVTNVHTQIAVTVIGTTATMPPSPSPTTTAGGPSGY